MKQCKMRMKLEYDGVPVVDVKTTDKKKIKKAFDDFQQKVF